MPHSGSVTDRTAGIDHRSLVNARRLGHRPNGTGAAIHPWSIRLYDLGATRSHLGLEWTSACAQIDQGAATGSGWAAIPALWVPEGRPLRCASMAS